MPEFFSKISDLGMGFSIIFTLVIPLLGAFTAAMIPNRKWRDISVVFASFLLFVNVINILGVAIKTSLPIVTLAEVIPGISLSFNIDPLGILFALVASFLWFVTSVYSIGYLKQNRERKQNRFLAFFALAVFGTIGVAFAGNLFTLFLFYEFLTLITFPLVVHSGTESAKRAGRIYLAYLLGSSFLFLIAIIWTWSLAGTLDFIPGGILNNKVSASICGALLLLYVYGVGKAALMPFHKWLPEAMVAPVPVSALLHAVAVVKAGVFAILKIVIYIFGFDFLSKLSSTDWWAGSWLSWLAIITIITASIIALRQDNLKLRLAYSTISQLAYIIFAASLYTPLAIVAGVYHIAAHAFSKITLFFVAGAIYTTSHKSKISDMDGIGRRMPFTMAAFTVAVISMIGLPPTAGYITKHYLLEGMPEGQDYFPILLIISAILNALYFLPIIFRAYFRKEKKNGHKYIKLPRTMITAIMITSFATIMLYFYPDFILWLGKIPAGIV